MLTKKEMKEIKVIDVKVNRLNCSSDPSGDYSTNCDVDFILDRSIKIDVFDKRYSIDRIKMGCLYGDILHLEYAQEGKTFCCFPVSKTFVHKVWDRVKEEQRDGVLEGWSLDEELMEILRGENVMDSCFY